MEHDARDKNFELHTAAVCISSSRIPHHVCIHPAGSMLDRTRRVTRTPCLGATANLKREIRGRSRRVSPRLLVAFFNTGRTPGNQSDESVLDVSTSISSVVQSRPSLVRLRPLATDLINDDGESFAISDLVPSSFDTYIRST